MKMNKPPAGHKQCSQYFHSCASGRQFLPLKYFAGPGGKEYETCVFCRKRKAASVERENSRERYYPRVLPVQVREDLGQGDPPKFRSKKEQARYEKWLKERCQEIER